MVMSSTSASSNFDKPALLDNIVVFVTRFDPVQIRYVGVVFRNLLDAIASGTWFPVC